MFCSAPTRGVNVYVGEYIRLCLVAGNTDAIWHVSSRSAEAGCKLRLLILSTFHNTL